MRTVTTFPHEIDETEHLWIEMSDGTHLAARLWRPVSADADPVPGVLEMIPYRKRDLTAQRDSLHHPYMAGHGYACLRVDLRGSGDSEGVLTDEYLEQELQDAEEVLAWMARQPWCSGRTAMMGISWGGFNALQVAARRPPSLGAIITLSSTDDRYTDDVHYMGGCLLTDNLSWASTMFAYTACPPDPALVGDAWRQMWQDRLEKSGLWLETWLRHQRRDDYWRHGSVVEDYSAIEVPVLAVSGWADGYSNAVFRLLAGLSSPVRGLIGPWSHKYPHLGEPGPAIGFLQEVVAWWDHWLKDDRDNGAMDGPALTIWMQDHAPPATTYENRPGRWVGEDSWPSDRIVPTSFPLGRYRIHPPGTESDSAPQSVRSPLSVGQFAGKWCSYNAPPDLPYDQREEDGGSLVFTSEELSEPLEILGAPLMSVDIAVDQPVAQVIVRLSDVAPDGEATRVTYGVLNLTHHSGSAQPTALTPGERRTVQVQLNGVAQRFPAGHRLRASLSTSYWPVVWPPPEPVRLTVHPAGSELTLPVRPVPEDETSPVFEDPEAAAPIATTQLAAGEQAWQVSRDLVDLTGRLDVVKDLGIVLLDDIDLAVRRDAREAYTFDAGDVSSVRGETLWKIGFSRGAWEAGATTRTVLTSSASDFHLYAELDAWEGEERVHSQTWSTTIPRDHV
ncbi:CocE/NonD family hydrolase [Brachybacterium sacelli]|uniref:CocE/NonD family hydrolase n=1 Tax=Brachybacterium sacelli TaxID=173364 RepID=A0ABS4WZF6_9MICO|nr:CocE/NonD family hydrolase [Brachybacterium sacelli]MBP2381584.1 putative CocE/NonD family hydrolase [Brachybacterium sacelli]